MKLVSAVVSISEANRQAKFDIDSTVLCYLFVIAIFYGHYGKLWDILFTTYLKYVPKNQIYSKI